MNYQEAINKIEFCEGVLNHLATTRTEQIDDRFDQVILALKQLTNVVKALVDKKGL